MPLIITPGQLNQRAELYHQISIMLTAGITLPQALEQAQRNAPFGLRPAIRKLLECFREGMTLTDALGELGRWIPSFDAALLEAGERSGRLDQTFKLLSVYYSERARMARQVISDLLWPLLTVHVAILVFPFIDWLKTNNTVVFVGTVLGILTLLYGTAFIIVYACQGRHGERWRALIESLLRPIPVLGTARRFLALARVAAALEALITAGVPIINAWELASTASGSPAIRHTVLSWKEALATGTTPAELVSQSSIFPELFAGVYHTGEISGKLDESLLRLHNIYQEEGSRKLRAAATWSPKIVYFGIMIFVGYKIISSYADMYGPNSDLGKILNGN
jgi:type II secretory pathway component PulF